MIDEFFMKRAIKLARKGRGSVSPNPMVGALLVRNGKIIGQGYHRRFGGPHAEINAIRNAKENVAGSTLYVTLEPCCHEGKTPPCVDSIIAHKIARVVIGSIDANPLVSCQGIDVLRQNGIEVQTGILADECRKLNEVFFHYMETGKPFVTIKYAQTLDGRIATSSGQSQWISSGASLQFAHRLRADHDAILVGCGTVIQDNPALTVRLVRGRNPLRVIVDSHLRIPLNAKVFDQQSVAKTLVVTTVDKTHLKWKKLEDKGVEMMSIKADQEDHVNLKILFKRLSQKNISSILIEGGANILTSVLRQNIADRLVVVMAPKIIGRGIEAIGDLNIRTLKAAKKISIESVIRLEDDIIIDGRFT